MKILGSVLEKNPKKRRLKNCQICGDPFYPQRNETVCYYCILRMKVKKEQKEKQKALKKKQRKKPYRSPSRPQTDFTKGTVYVLDMESWEWHKEERG